MIEILNRVIARSRRLILQNEPKPETPSVTEIVAEEWFRDRGDETHRLEYDLNSSSVVIDVGGYKGQWASDIYARYRPKKVIIYEPHPTFAVLIKNRFETNRDIVVKNYGLGAFEREVELFDSCDGSTTHARDAAHSRIKVRLADANRELQDNNLTVIDLIKINIEGSEYELLENLITNHWHHKIRNIQVQFHDNVPEYRDKRRSLTDKLLVTHKRTYCYPMVWENWVLRHQQL